VDGREVLEGEIEADEVEREEGVREGEAGD
jgi:hypothetical protein